ncbi:MAG: aspartate--tRNA ligase [Candidatus Harrisonbacteria bacterium CG10_big_fil_rev_8_21_14_0_10_40_38]|uniref:Aspartate--tRNA(Asp/Asn) ligase n=1 Tax=Candidatus Harrisonbacteria bacterium CG10_big_fil_rev_8_21_14_0_10_40_38 TaxID=1974583 RepID=A0A2H0USW8_9BACT|nr:MAG: aspartate--tRNA ligase [Candidatus Harrisonbacteria bacterium CG10_big_fil_rev_8_21_14_0_10_40_38]
MRILTKEIISKEGELVELSGWVSVRRDHGKIIFIDLRDRTGIVQVVFIAKDKELYSLANTLRPEWVVKIKGTVNKRPENMINPDIATGKFELLAESMEILNESITPPFPLETDGREIDEEVRLKYRYVDLRRERMQKIIRLRSQFVDRVRQFLFKNDFVEIETPMLTKSTPEGSRDFVVPSRLHPGKFFALPQSPQQYKQLLMVGGFERYFQIARCIRDEDLRADRGFEHTQIDMEVSFTTREEFMALDEAMITSVCESLGYKIKEKPFPIISYADAMKKHGADKFDLRDESDKENGVLAFAWVVDFPFFSSGEGFSSGGEKNEKGKSSRSEWTFTHNPFSMPIPEHIDWLVSGKNIGEILTSQYDLVCNGFEVGGGSVRAHRPEILKATFKVLGYSDKETNEQFGHMVDALSQGAPPHGGIAHGVERLLMTLTGEKYLREVQAFPQTSSGRTSVMDAPSDIYPEQLKELGIAIEKKKKNI